MEFTVFAKKRVGKDGAKFTTYLTTLTKKTGEKVVCAIKFAEECGAPKADKCPLNIVCEKSAMNFSTRTVTKADTGELVTSNTLWVKSWKESSTPFVDTSMDEFC